MNDETIIELYFARDESAIAETKASYGKLLRSIAYGILASAQDAEECENEACLRAWNSIPPARPQRLSAYLCQIARRLAFDRYDYRSAAKRGPSVALEELENVLSADISAEDRFSENQLAALLKAFLHEQDHDTRVIFLRRYWFCETTREIAKRFNVSESMVKSRLSRTKKRLREFLKKEGYNV